MELEVSWKVTPVAVGKFCAMLSYLSYEEIYTLRYKLTRSFLYDREIAFVLFQLLKRKSRRLNHLYDMRYECSRCSLSHYLLNFPMIRETVITFVNAVTAITGM
jgi:hypothetical protein